jgi:hypothetical protein
MAAKAKAALAGSILSPHIFFNYYSILRGDLFDFKK